MSRITVLGRTGFAGSAIVAEAASRGHSVTALSRSAPDHAPVHAGVSGTQGDVTVGVGPALRDQRLRCCGRRARAARLTRRDPSRRLLRARPSRRCRRGGAVHRWRLLLAPVGTGRTPVRGGSQPRAGRVPRRAHHHVGGGRRGPRSYCPTLKWVFVSPAGRFGPFAPGERLGRYRVGGEVAVEPDGGWAISGADFALGFVDLIEQGDQHRVHLNLAY